MLRRLATIVALLACVGLAARRCLDFVPNTIDDAWITFRYADNLAHGLGFVFNEGERVEGTSSLLLTIMLVPVRWFGGDPLAAARANGVASFVGLIVGAYAFVKPHGAMLGLAAAAMVASSTSLAYYAMSGLETTMFAGLTFAATAMFIREPRGRWAYVAGLAALARPEGAWLFAVLWLSARRTGWAEVRRFAVVYGPALALRVAYFGALVPNTVLAKGGHPVPGAPVAIHHVVEFATALGPAVITAVSAVLGRPTRRAAVVLLLVVLFPVAVDALDAGGDWMPFARLLTPAIAPAACLAALGAAALGSRWSPLWLVSVALWVAAQALATSPPHDVSPMEAYRVDLGRRLATVARPDDLLATDMAGIIPYYSGLPTLDMNGLTDRHIATEGEPYGPMGKIDRAYVISRRPTFIQTNNVGEVRALFAEPTFPRDAYAAVITRPYQVALGRGLRDRKLLVVRKDRHGFAELAAALDGAVFVDLEHELMLEP